jgi:hypothetical protein
LLLVLVILAGCGGSGKSNLQTQTVKGVGYRFEAPAGWTVTHADGTVAAASGAVDRVEVRTFKLARPYRPQLFQTAVRELDSVIARIAQQLTGHVTSRRTVRVAGRQARSYSIAYDEDKTQEITFVLQGRKEHQLLCRRLADTADDACQNLLESFALG